MIRNGAIAVVALLVGLAGILIGRTVVVGPPPLDPVPKAEPMEINIDAVSARLAEAVSIRTISFSREAPVEKDAFFSLHDHLERSFPKVHEVLTREIVNDYSLLYTWPGSDPTLRAILFAAHQDVVPADPATEADWTYPPFSGETADGFVWGRGTLDMKQSLMAILEAVEFLLSEGFVPERTVYLAFGHDDEIGGANGAARIAEMLGERGVRLNFTLDEGLVITQGIVPAVSKPAALVGLAEKGAVALELRAGGEGGHSSRPPVSTAVGKLARAIHRLETNQMPARLGSPITDMFTYLSPEMPLAWRVVLANRWLFDPWLIARLERSAATNASIRTTTAPTVIRGGVKTNILPKDARALIDFRILPGDSVDSVIEHVRMTIDDPDITVRQTARNPSEPSLVSNPEAPGFIVLRRTIHQVFPDVLAAPGLVIGRTDSRHYGSLADNGYRFVPARLGPEDLPRIHGTDERIAVDNYAEIIQFYIQLLRNAAS
ncbi:MAG: M20 family peptidase [Alphaproteobacteria bacterium]